MHEPEAFRARYKQYSKRKIGMATPTENWVYDKNIVTEKDRKALEKAKEIEKDKLEQGYRYIKVNNRLQVLVPCDENGNPTEKGMAIIKEKQALYGIK